MTETMMEPAAREAAIAGRPAHAVALEDARQHFMRGAAALRAAGELDPATAGRVEGAIVTAEGLAGSLR